MKNWSGQTPLSRISGQLNSSLPGHECAEFAMTAVITLEPREQDLKYKALVMHSSQENRARHEKMGFLDGWGKALDQMLEMIKKG